MFWRRGPFVFKMAYDLYNAKDQDNKHPEYHKFLKYPRKAELSSYLEGEWSKNEHFFTPDEENGYVECKLLKSGDPLSLVQLKSMEEVDVPTKTLVLMNPPIFDGVEDCAFLPELSTPSVLHNLRKRYACNLIYTYSGLFLVAINPYKNVPIYSENIARMYLGKRKDEIAPHIFALSDFAYRQMINNHLNQSLLITGESGAGKTENTKKVIQYIAQIAGRTGGVGELENQLIELNPLLESFGNAKTNRNNNSSRFGKFVKLLFTHGGLVSGASVSSYLLEKSRVISQLQGERNFHIFYQLLCGSSPEEKKLFRLDAINKNNYLKHDHNINGWDDVKEFQHTKSAMKLCGINGQEQQDIFRLIAGILSLGNIQFGSTTNDQATIENTVHLKSAAELLEVDTDILEKGLLEPRIEVGSGKAKELVLTRFTKEKALDSRDAISKEIYNRLFLWIVSRINTVLARPDSSSFIGVLDIAGFEIFDKNSFEQICINYTNERLQQFFNNYMFKYEQEEYEKEKINWKFVNFGVDSQTTIDLISRPPYGILKILDEECLFPNGTDYSFMEKMAFRHKGSSRWCIPRTYEQNIFFLKHYAGEVKYDATNWVLKNKDPIQKDLVTCFQQSKSSILLKIFVDSFLEQSDTPLNSRHGGSLIDSDPKANPTSGSNRAYGGAQFQFVAKKYDSQLGNLLNVLGSTEPHFVRCILPNYRQRNDFFIGSIIREQLRYNGVLEGIRISRLGFPNRVLYPEFLKRFHLLAPNISQQSLDPKSDTRLLIDELVKKNIINLASTPEFDDVNDLYRFGTSKVFFRTGQLTSIEAYRQEKISEFILVIQSACRGYSARQMFKKLKFQTSAANVIKSNSRTFLDFRNWAWWKLFVRVRPLLEQKKHKDELLLRDSKIAELSSELDLNSREKDTISVHLKTVQEKLTAVQKRYDAELQKYEASEKERCVLQKELETLLSKSKLLDTELENEMKVNNDLVQLKRRMEGRFLALEEELEEATTERDGLISKLRDTTREKGDLERSGTSLTDELGVLRDKLSRLNSEKSDLLAKVDDYESSLKRVEGENKILQSGLEEVKESKEELLMKIADLKRANGKLTQTQNDLEARILEQTLITEKAESLNKKMMKEQDFLSEKVRNMEDGMMESDQKKKNLQRTVEDLSIQIEHLQSQKSKNEENSQRLQIELEQSLNSFSEMESQKVDIDGKVKTLDVQIRDLTSRLDEKDTELFALNKELKSKHDENVTLHSNIEDVEREIARNESHSKKIAAELENTNYLFKEERTAHVALQKKIKKMKEEIDSLRRQLEEEHLAHNQSKAMIKKLEQHLQEYRHSLDSGGQKEQILSNSVKTLEQQITQLKDDLELEQRDKSKLRNQLREKDSEIQDIEDSLEEANQQRDKSETSLKKVEVELYDLSLQLTEKEEILTKEAVARKAADASALLLSDQVSAESRRTSFLENSFKEVEKEKSSLHSQIERLQADSEKLKRTVSKNQKTIDTLESQLGAAQELVRHLEGANKKMNAQLDEITDHFQSNNAQLESFRKGQSAAEKEIEVLTSKLDTSETACIKAERLVSALKAEIVHLEDELEDALSDSDFKREIASKQEEINLLKSLLEREKEGRNRSELQRKQTEKHLNLMRSEVEESEKEKIDLKRKAKSLTGEANDAQERANASERENQRILKEKKRLSEELKKLKNQLMNMSGMVSEDDLRQLQNNIEDLKDQIEVANVGKEVADKKSQAFQFEVEQLREQCETEMRAKDKALRDRKRLDIELEEEKDKVEELEEQLDLLEEWKMKNQTKVDDLQIQLQSLMDDKIKNEEDIKTFRTQLDDTRMMLDASISQKNELQFQVNALSGGAEELEIRMDAEAREKEKAAKAAKAAKKKAAALEQQLFTETSSRTETEKELTQLRQDFDRLLKDMENLRSEKSTLESAKKNLDSVCIGLREQIEEITCRRNRADAARRAAEADVVDLRNQLDEVEDEKQDFEFKYNKRMQEAISIQQRLDREIENTSRFESVRADLETKFAEFRDRAEQFENENTLLLKSKAISDADAASFNEDLELANRKVLKFEKASKRALKENKILRTQLAEAEANSRNELSNATRLQHELNRNQDRIQELNDIELQLVNENKKVLSEKAELRDEIERLSSANRELKEEKDKVVHRARSQAAELKRLFSEMV